MSRLIPFRHRPEHRGSDSSLGLFKQIFFGGGGGRGGGGDWLTYRFFPVSIIPPLLRIYIHILVSLNRRTHGLSLDGLHYKLCSSGNGEHQHRHALCGYLKSLNLEYYLKDFCYE